MQTQDGQNMPEGRKGGGRMKGRSGYSGKDKGSWKKVGF